MARQAYLRQKAEIIAEIELFLLLPSERNKIEWFPHLIYYEAHLDSITTWRRKLDREEQGEVDVEFIRNELKVIREELQSELKGLKGNLNKIMSKLGSENFSENVQDGEST